MSSPAPKTAQSTTEATSHLRHATKDNAPLVEGRRAYLKYRDLGVTEASDGKLRAQVMQTIDGYGREHHAPGN